MDATSSHPRFPRGFVISQEFAAPEGYVQSSTIPELRYDPVSPCHHYRGRNVDMAVIGTCVPITRSVSADYNPASDLLPALESSRAGFFARLAEMAGRYIVIVRARDSSAKGQIEIFHDATGMRTVFFRGKSAASHARLLVHDAEGDADTFPHQWGFPGDHAPWPDVARLTPNNSLDLHSGKITRYYPEKAPSAISVTDAAARVSEWVKYALINYGAMHGPLKLGLTAGLDSRVTCALTHRSGADCEYFTYIKNDTRSKNDAMAAARISALLGKDHVTARSARASQQFSDFLKKNGFYTGNSSTIAPLSGDHAFLSSNTLEIGRLFYARFMEKFEPPTTARSCTNFYIYRASKKRQKDIEKYGTGRYNEKTEAAFRDFFDRATFAQACEFLEPFDAYYWEHRMAAWHAGVVLTRDFACDTFIPFNARKIFDTLLGVSLHDREMASVFFEIVARNCPQLSGLPVNPQ